MSVINPFKVVYRYFLIHFKNISNSHHTTETTIVNTLLIVSIIITLAALITTLESIIFTKTLYDGVSPLVIIVILSLLTISYSLSIKGYTKLASYSLILLILLPSMYSSIRWGSLMEQSLLLYVLAIVLTGICVGSKSTLIITIIISTFLVILSLLQSKELLPYDDSWRKEIFDMEDAVMASLTLFTISLISWFHNYKQDALLSKLTLSERNLRSEKDLLETRVELRTKELKLAQEEKIRELNKFVYFGKITSGLIHDLATPLTTISLTLNKLKDAQKELEGIKSLINTSITAAQKMEEFLESAKKDFSNSNRKVLFDIGNEIESSILLLSYKAKKHNIYIHYQRIREYLILGIPNKFHKVCTNILNNAVDSYNGVSPQTKEIAIDISMNGIFLCISFNDNGCGISSNNLENIFQPFFTTKQTTEASGLGLSICKEIIENDFSGRIYVRSVEGKGSTFTLEIPKPA